MLERGFVKAYGWLALFTFLSAALLVSPSLLMRYERAFYRSRFPADFSRWTNNGTFSDIECFENDGDNYIYTARIHDAATHLIPGDPYIKGDRGAALALKDFITWEAYALVFRAVGGVRWGLLASQFLFTLFWIPCLWTIASKMGAGRGQALWLASAVTLFADMARIVLLDRGVGLMLRQAVQYAFWFLGSYHYFFGPTRITGPLFTYPCLFLAGLAFLRAQESRSKAMVAWSGLAGGLLAYVHADVWCSFLGASGLYAIWDCAVRREIRWRSVLPPILALAASLPWILLSRPAPDQLTGFGASYVHGFALVSLPSLAGAALAWFALPRRPMTVWCACLLLSMGLASNSTLVVGIAYGGNWWYIGNVFLALVAGVWATSRLKFSERDWLWLTVATFLLAVPRAVSYAALHYRVYALPAAQEEAFDWLDRHTPPDAVVAALSPDVDLRLGIYTHDKSVHLVATTALFSEITFKENEKRLAYALSLYGVKFDDYLRYGEDASGRWQEKLWDGVVDADSHERSGRLSTYWMVDWRGEIIRGSREAERGPIQDFGADYLWVGRFERALAGADFPGRRSGLTKVFENRDVTIYAVRRSS